LVMIDEPVVKVDGVFETIGTLTTQKKALEAELAAVLKGRDRVIADLEAANRHIELLESLLVEMAANWGDLIARQSATLLLMSQQLAATFDGEEDDDGGEEAPRTPGGSVVGSHRPGSGGKPAVLFGLSEVAGASRDDAGGPVDAAAFPGLPLAGPADQRHGGR
jgi:hypothetical protein